MGGPEIQEEGVQLQKSNFNQLRDLLAVILWSSCFSGCRTDEAWLRFKDLLLSVANQCIPKVSLNPKKRMNWLLGQSLHMIWMKKRAFRLAKRTQKRADFRRYKDISNRVRDLTRKDHCEHLEEITKDLTLDQRPFWGWLKNMRGHHPCIPDLHQFGKVLFSSTEKAEAFKTFFSSVFTCEDHKRLDGLEEELRFTRIEVEIGEIALTVREVYEELCRIDPSKQLGPMESPVDRSPLHC